MDVIKTRELKRRYELDGPRQTIAHLTGALAEGHLRPEDFSIRDLAEGLVPDGHEWVRGLIRHMTSVAGEQIVDEFYPTTLQQVEIKDVVLGVLCPFRKSW